MRKRVACIVLMLLFGCHDSQTVAPPSKETSAVQPNARILAGMQNIVTADDLRNMLAAQRSIVFVDVDWSGYSARARRVVRDFMEAWKRDNSGPAVAFYRLNLSEQKGPLWNATGDWLSTQSAPRQIMVAGAGSLIWVSKGKIEHHLLNASTSTTTELIEQTRRVYKVSK